MSQHKSRHTDIPWLKEDLENALRTFCDSQYLSKRQHEVYDELEQHKLNKARQDKDDKARTHIAQLSDDLTHIQWNAYGVMCISPLREKKLMNQYLNML